MQPEYDPFEFMRDGNGITYIRLTPNSEYLVIAYPIKPRTNPNIQDILR